MFSILDGGGTCSYIHDIAGTVSSTVQSENNPLRDIIIETIMISFRTLFWGEESTREGGKIVQYSPS